MCIDILACTNIQDALGSSEIVRTFTIRNEQIENAQICYFDRFKSDIEKICADLLERAKTTCITHLRIRVSCHGYNHHADFKNGKIGVLK
jgi:hypothetical protein